VGVNAELARNQINVAFDVRLKHSKGDILALEKTR
jgi:hypothetical protein